MSKKKTHEEYIAEVAKINPNIEVVERYIGANIKILHKCKIDGYEWEVLPSDILHGKGCPKCGLLSRKQKRTKSHDEYVESVNKISPDIEVVEKYIKSTTPILHKCKIDGHEWLATSNNILRGKGCPVCKHQVIGNSPEYKNSIWSSEYKDLFAKYMTEEQMQQCMPKSNIKIKVKCPYCGKLKNIAPYNLLLNGLGCTCSDGQSYPNKFIYSFLNQLHIDYISEYSCGWANGKRYDIYIPSLNCIIENHGKQHYDKNSFELIGGRTLEEELQNDKDKKEIAIKNGIEYYVELDCRISSKEWISNHIVSSQLLDIIGMKILNVNWEICDEFATSNRVKDAADLWERGMSIRDISKNLNIDKVTVRSYLKKATSLNWCDYNSKESRRRGALHLKERKRGYVLNV